jgi:hypothetical protein
MVAKKKLNERYLLVDLVSADQGGPHDIQQQVARMDLIYRLADITLVAATAKDANCSLPGIQKPRPTQEHVLQINGRRIYCSLQVEDIRII